MVDTMFGTDFVFEPQVREGMKTTSRGESRVSRLRHTTRIVTARIKDRQLSRLAFFPRLERSTINM